jgi:precorrin-6Y C5,15-methyltransferase (decarboxylating)
LTAIGADCRAGIRAAVIVSGDPGVFSLLAALKRRLGDENLTVVPGVSALQAFCAALGEAWQDSRVLSGHGRILSENALAYTVRTNASVVVFCDAERSPAWVCATLVRAGLPDTSVAVGERLGYADERVTIGAPGDLARGGYDALSMARVLNPDPEPAGPRVGMPDDAFIRGKTPMTKREIRAGIASALRLRPDALVWDIGAGTGSVTIESALQCPFGDVYAVERDAGAIELIRRNIERFHALNVHVVEGSAPDALAGLPAPTHVFIGGSGGGCGAIIDSLRRLDAPFRLAATAVTLETAHELLAALSDWHGVEAAQLAVSRLELVGGCHMFRARNPVFIISADWEGRA